MAYEGIIDPASAAGLASEALQQSLKTLTQVNDAASAAASSATAAAAAQAAVTTLLNALGVTYRWSGTILQLQLPNGSWGPGVDLQGEPGPVGPVPLIQVGTVTEGEFAIVIPKGSNPLAPTMNFTLPRGLAAWTPVVAGVISGARCLMQIVDWTGGGGAKPATGVFIGPAGFVTDPAAAIDYRGAAGGTIVSGTPTTGHLAVFSGPNAVADGGVLTTFAQSLLAAVSPAAAKTLLAIAAGDVSGLGAAALLGVGSGANQVAPGNDARFAAAEQSANKGVANGYAGLDATGKVPAAFLPAAVLGDVQYQSAWNAATNTPAIPAAAPANKGWYFVVQTAGTTTISGQSDWQPGDWLVSNGTSWDKIDNTDAVKSVANLVGAISAAALKAALAIGTADIVDASTLGRAVLTAASAAALTAMLVVMTGDAGAGGKAGLVPAPAAGDAAAARFLRADGTWAAPGSVAAINYLLCLSM